MKIFIALLFLPLTSAFVPFIDGGKGIPKLYDGYFNEQVAKQAASAMSRAIAAGNVSGVYYSAKSKILIHFTHTILIKHIELG